MKANNARVSSQGVRKSTHRLVNDKKVVRKKEESASASSKSRPGTAEIVGTGLAIGMGIAGSHGRSAKEQGHGIESNHSKGMMKRGGGGIGMGF
jgi:hypothetical protein